ncbi:MAG: asparagine synthase (glutamine-hydrolyzing) [Nitrospinaceae bacterium]
MCGITGLMDSRNRLSADALEDAVRAMAQTLHHRGPDDQGVWVDPETGMALGHTRLSVIDLSHEGHQPMVSRSGRYVLVYNGEVYNFQELQKELESLGGSGAASWHGHSDTEAVLAAIEHWGLEAALSRFVGMFAFALWDRRERQLHLVRDRLGIKPLFYGWCGGGFLFGSELRALRRHADFEGQVCREALVLLLRHNYIPAPHAIFENVRKLPPGCRLTVQWPFTRDLPEPLPYWSAWEKAQQGLAAPWTGSGPEAVQRLDDLLRDAVRLRLISDVPLGAFLSGGVDSSLVVALMRQVATGPVKTFSIGFRESGFNEAEYAKKVARHLGTEHTELYLTGEEAMATVPRLPELFDEPFGDSSQIPTLLVSELARREVTVALSGDGGDELFGGYAQYLWGPNVLNLTRWAPLWLRRGLASTLTRVSTGTWDRLLNPFRPVLGRRIKMDRLGEKMHKLARLIRQREVNPTYRIMISIWENAASAVLGAQDPPFPSIHGLPSTGFSDPVAYMMFVDSVMYLPGDILTKVDRASMAVSLEARVPLLDHRVYEFAWTLPRNYKIRQGATKWLLRQVLHRYVPRHLIERPKMGFSIPLAAWLRGPLRDWAEDLLDASYLRRDGILDPQPILEKWREHVTGKRDWAAVLWSVLMFQAWRRKGK